MRAARYYGPGDVRVENIQEPQPLKGQLKIKVYHLLYYWLKHSTHDA
jgi:hypothetical protein